MVWVKETATLPRLMLVNTVPSMCPKASGAMLPSCAAEILDAGWSLVAHMRKMSREPNASWKAVMVYGSGSGSAPRTCGGERTALVDLDRIEEMGAGEDC